MNPQALPPMMIDVDDVRLRGGGAFVARPGQNLVLVVPDGTEADWTAVVHSPEVVRFIPGGDQGSWIARPGFEALAVGGAKIEINGPGYQDLWLLLEVTEDGEEPPVVDPSIAIPAAITEIAEEVVGMSETAAVRAVAAAGGETRVTERDGESFPMTMDYRTDRVNLRIANGVVTEATIG